MTERNHFELSEYLKKNSPSLLGAIELARYIFNNIDEDQEYDLVFVVMDYVYRQGASIEEIAKQCLYASSQSDDQEFAGATLYWLQVQNELTACDGKECSLGRDAAHAVVDCVRASAGKGVVADLIDVFISRGVVRL